MTHGLSMREKLRILPSSDWKILTGIQTCKHLFIWCFIKTYTVMFDLSLERVINGQWLNKNNELRTCVFLRNVKMDVPAFIVEIRWVNVLFFLKCFSCLITLKSKTNHGPWRKVKYKISFSFMSPWLKNEWNDACTRKSLKPPDGGPLTAGDSTAGWQSVTGLLRRNRCLAFRVRAR